MPTIFTHPVVALALAPCFGRRRLSVGIILLGMLCAIVPDLDVVGFRFGIPYGSPFGHRGFSHSLAFAVLLAASLSLLLRLVAPTVSGWRVFLFLFLCTASHGVLDALTNGGHGIAFFAPFSNQRYFFPWRPIQVSPLDISRFLSGQAWPVIISELKWVVMPSLSVAVAMGWMHRLRKSRSD